MFKRRFPCYYQRDTLDCGATCLQSIASFYGKFFKLENIRNHAFLTNNGASMRGVKAAAEYYGFQTSAFQLTLDALLYKFNGPCILYWNQCHYVVLYKIKKKNNRADKFYIADPGCGRMVLSRDVFEQAWLRAKREQDNKSEGIALFLYPTEAFYRHASEKEKLYFDFHRIYQYAKPYKKTFLLVLYCVLFANVLQFLFPFLTQIVVDVGIKEESFNVILLVLIAQMILYTSNNLFDFIRRFLLIQVNSRINILMISDFLKKLTSLPLSFFDTKLLGDILQRINDHSKIENFLTNSFVNIVFSFSTLLIFSLVLAIYNFKILLLFVAGSLIYVGWIYLFLERRKELDYARFIQQSVNSSNLVEFIVGMKDIKLYNCHNQKRWNWERTQIQLLKLNIQNLTNEQYQSLGSLLINQIKNALITFVCARLVIEGELTLGMMLSVQFIVGQLEGPISQSVDFMHSWQDAKLSFERMGEIYLKENEAKSYQRPLPPHRNDDIRIENISFQYGSPFAPRVLDGINLHIPYGKTTAIVGASGSGKTTLVKLLLGFYQPLEGEIRIGDRSMEQIDLASWRDRCGVVLQDSYIFSDTILNNITLSDEHIDFERLKYAARMANIFDLILSFPQHFYTKIGSEGQGLSQGQRQRLLIARAIYKQPDYLFLDEATNSLDASNENQIKNNLDILCKNKTSVIIAHRFSTIKHADQIIVMDKGRIVEQGTHSELMENTSVYYHLMKEQLNLN